VRLRELPVVVEMRQELCPKSLLLACEAGESIKPKVERGFASETPGAMVY